MFSKVNGFGGILGIFMDDWEGVIVLKLGKIVDIGITKWMTHYGMADGYKVVILKIKKNHPLLSDVDIYWLWCF